MRRVPSFLAWLKAPAALAGLALATASFAPACTSEVVCDSSKCGAGNKCIAFEGKTECRKTCTSNVSGAGACPFGYTCSAAGGADAFCVEDAVTLTRGKGQWGAACNPTGGLERNPDCDFAQGFICSGKGPDDADAYCTRENCTEDRQCGAGFYCGTTNLEPNVTTSNRSVGVENTIRTCLKRSYCAPCKVDLDCLPVNGRPQHCIPDDDGKGVCAPECDSSKGCNNEAQCLDFVDYKVCFPRAGRCAGDGTVCSPCRSDADCPQGACVKGQYTTEKSCTVASPITCKDGPTNGVDYQCPDFTLVDKRAIRCLGGLFFDQVPRNHCHGLYPIGESADVGCWTPNR